MTEPPEVPRLELDDALRRFWKYLIGVAVFPIAFSLDIEIFHTPSAAFAPLFLAVTILAGWPYLARRAPYTFWLVAMGVWMGGGFVGIFLSQLVRFIFGLPLA